MLHYVLHYVFILALMQLIKDLVGSVYLVNLGIQIHITVLKNASTKSSIAESKVKLLAAY